MTNDVRDIMERLAAIEARTTPVSVKHGLNQQQKGVPQMPALFKPKHISVLGSKTDPKHPADGYMVGDSVEPKKTALEETMGEIEEDMLSKVKKDLNQYLDKLEKKVSIDRTLKDKAIAAVQKGRAEEEIEENDYELTEPETVHDVEDKVDTAAAQPQAPIQTETLDDGTVFEVHGDEQNGFEIRHGDRPLRSRFRNLADAGMAIELFRARRKQQAKQDLSQDYVEEK